MKFASVSNQERRRWQRFRVTAAVSLLINGQPVTGYTQDICNHGVYLMLPAGDGLNREKEFDFVVELPPEITLSSGCEIWCSGRALRIDEGSSQTVGVATEIIDYAITNRAAHQ